MSEQARIDAMAHIEPLRRHAEGCVRRSRESSAWAEADACYVATMHIKRWVVNSMVEDTLLHYYFDPD
jgi:hypothetical protein